ncbi:MAG: hypothetical protein HOE90_08350 [Bacteriovoracaceae bacterium]|nr:hypothetical protein [Bacteriovoracaceae bacterium]
MFAKTIMKNPVLMIGIIMFSIFLYNLNGKYFVREKHNKTSCENAIRHFIKKKAPGNWKLECNKNNLAVTVSSILSVKDPKSLKPALYRNLANHMVYLAKNTVEISMERVFIVRFHIDHPSITIDMVTEGKHISKLATITHPKFIKEHLQATAKISEKIKQIK